MNLLLSLVVNAAALGAATWLLDGISVSGADDTERALTLLGVAAVFGVVNTFITPIIKLVSLPFIILTLGLLLLVINALMLQLTSAISGGLGLGFEVDDFGTALVGGLVISIVSTVLGWVLGTDD